MANSARDAPLILVLGPTGAGKSGLALDLAETFHGEIVNCDSVQLYRRFDVGAAKVPMEERRGIAHHLIDILDPEETFTAGDYVKAARPVLREIVSRGRIPVVAGGTGFYVRALLLGLFTGPTRDEELRARLAEREQRRAGFLHRALRRFDPAAASRIHANDRNKLVRALEVCLTARAPMSVMFRQGRDPLEGFVTLKIGLDPPRDALYERLDARCVQMLHGGLIEETRAILDSGVPPAAKPFESIGYKQTLQLVTGQLGFDEALEQMQRDTRRYAKRQLTWFRREPGVRWLSGFGTDETTRSLALEISAKFFHEFQS